MPSRSKKIRINLIKIHMQFLTILVCMVLSVEYGFSAPVSPEMANQVAINFLHHIGSSHTIASIESVEPTGQQVAHLARLSPRGYILVAGDDIRVPVKGYSLKSSFSDLPEPYRQTLLRDLAIPTTVSPTPLSATSNAANASYWEFLTQPSAQALSPVTLESYTPDTFLLSTRWDQTYPYNKLNPKIDGELTLTGCTQTAIAQVMRYHSHPATGSGVFNHNWNSQDFTAVMNRPFNWDAMPDSVNGSVPQHQQDEVAALMRDLGVLNQANFGVAGTSAGFNYWDFERAFGYAPIYFMNNSDPDAFFSTIKEEIDNLRPLLLRMPGHLTVADGYASDGSGKNIHVNLGWGGAYDDYYFLDQTNVIGSYSFPPDHSIYYNIRPCQGAECNPFASTGGGQPPVIASVLPDMITDTATTMRIEVYDPDGDTVTLSASSACEDLQVEFNTNMLTLTPLQTDLFCQVGIQAQSHDGTVSKSFNVLILEDMIHLGTNYDIGGQFSDVSEVDEYRVYLGGAITVSGNRGYSNQAFFIWINDQDDNTALGPGDNPISGTLTSGIYTISASLTSGYTSYTYNEEYSGYILSIAADDLAYTVSDLAADLGISLISHRLTVNTTGSSNGTITSVPNGIDCGIDCSESFPIVTEVTLTASADNISMFTGWSGDCAGETSPLSLEVNTEKHCTAIFETDQDQDAMPDAWESAHGLDPDINDASEDLDGDGVSNIDEYHQGTDPESAPASGIMPWILLLLLDS